MKRHIIVNHISRYTENEKHKAQDFRSSSFANCYQQFGVNFDYNRNSIVNIDTLKVDKRLNYKRGHEKEFCKIVDRIVKYCKSGYSNGSSGKMDDVKMKLANVTKKCGQRNATAGNEVKKRSSRMRSNAVKIDNHTFTTEISNALAELITTMNGCVCQYICEKAKIQKMMVSFCFGKSNSQKLFIYGNENGMKYAIKLLEKIKIKML
jgi:hypothetical protein